MEDRWTRHLRKERKLYMILSVMICMYDEVQRDGYGPAGE